MIGEGMKIILDCFGGDTCPGSAIDGAILALCEDPVLPDDTNPS